MVHDIKFQIIQVKFGNEQINCIDARELWQRLGSRQDFSTWVKRRLNETQAEENEDYVKEKSIPQKSGIAKGGDLRSIHYFLSLDLAKEFAMLERNEIGRKIRRYFIEIEKCFRASALLHKDTAELLNLFNLNYQTPGASAILQQVKKLEHKRNAKCSRVLEYAYKEYFQNGQIKIDTEILLDYDREIYLEKD